MPFLMTQPTAEWNTFADDVDTLNATSEELFTFNYLHDIYNTDFTSVLETSLANIGIVINKSLWRLEDPQSLRYVDSDVV